VEILLASVANVVICVLGVCFAGICSNFGGFSLPWRTCHVRNHLSRCTCLLVCSCFTLPYF